MKTRLPVRRRPGRPAAVHLFAIGTVLVIAMSTAGCSSTPPGSPNPSATPATSPTGDGTTIDHAAGPTDVVFRFEEGGGFVPIDFFATQAPQFTLYGDGTVIFRDNGLPVPARPNPNIASLAPFEMARLDKPAIQAFLRFALADSGLGVARASYRAGNVADAPTATFTIHAGGLAKTVSVEALGFDRPDNPDSAIVKALGRLAVYVGSFGSAVTGETTWAPPRWRGVLAANATIPSIPWPWDDLTPADFVQHAGAEAPQFPIHTLTPAQVAKLGLTGIDGGFSGLGLTGPDGKVYAFALRPLFPDESF